MKNYFNSVTGVSTLCANCADNQTPLDNPNFRKIYCETCGALGPEFAMQGTLMNDGRIYITDNAGLFGLYELDDIDKHIKRHDPEDHAVSNGLYQWRSFKGGLETVTVTIMDAYEEPVALDIVESVKDAVANCYGVRPDHVIVVA